MSRNKWVLSSIILAVLLGAALWLGPGPLGLGSAKNELIQEASAEAILDHVRGLNSPVTLVNFWASWCEPCKVEFPHILKIRKDLEAQGLRVVFVSVDDPSDVPAAEMFLKEQQVDFPTFYKGTHSLNIVSKIFPAWSGAVPATVLLGPDLKVLDGWEGDTSLEEFQERIGKFLKGT